MMLFSNALSFLVVVSLDLSLTDFGHEKVSFSPTDFGAFQ